MHPSLNRVLKTKLRPHAEEPMKISVIWLLKYYRGSSTWLTVILCISLLAVNRTLADDNADTIGLQLIGTWSASMDSEESRLSLEEMGISGKCVKIYDRQWDLDVTSFDPITHQGKGRIIITNNWHASYEHVVYEVANAEQICFNKAVHSNSDQNLSRIDKYDVSIQQKSFNPRKFSTTLRQTDCDGDECGHLSILDRRFELFEGGDLMYFREQGRAVRLKKQTS